MNPNLLRRTALARNIRAAQLAGRQVLLAVEAAVLVPVAALLGWTAVAPASVNLALVAVVPVLGAAILVGIAWMALPEETPRAPSWLEQQQAAATVPPEPVAVEPDRRRGGH